MEGRIEVLPGERAGAETAATTSFAIPPTCRDQSMAAARKWCVSTWRLWNWSDSSTTRPPTTTGPSTGRCPGLFCASVSAIPSRFTSRTGEDSVMFHSVDFHAAMGPGGGSEFTQTRPGRESVVTFKALVPGLFVYHCATPSVAHHITNGMYGLILVEPEGGLPQVDREFYVMQGELYTAQPFGSEGDSGDGLRQAHLRKA